MHSQDHSIGASETTRFVTLTRDDPDFKKYLEGQPQRGWRAIPVASYGVSSSRERVTFSIKENVQSHWLKGLWTTARPEFLPLTLGPAFLGFAAALDKGVSIPIEILLSTIFCLMALHVAAFARNDYDDHLRGVDRVQHRRGSQVIQKGWLTAKEVRWISIFALGLAGIFALALLPHSSTSVGLLVGLGLFAVLGYSWGGQGLKALGLGDLVLGLCLGPLITLGIGELVEVGDPIRMIVMGLPLGLGAVTIIQLRQLESIVAERQLNSGTLVARLGFDSSKRMIQTQIFIQPFVVLAVVWAWHGAIFGVGSGVLTLLANYRLMIRIHRAASPLSSTLLGLSRSAVYLHLAMSTILIAAIGLA